MFRHSGAGRGISARPAYSSGLLPVSLCRSSYALIPTLAAQYVTMNIGILFVAAAFLLLEVLGLTLS
jgi:hypothetical protein